MLKIIQVENNPINSNCFCIFDKQCGSRCLIIDPGSEVDNNILSIIQSNELAVEYIILTHEHFDHIWSVSAIIEKFPKALLVCNKECGERIADRKKNYSLFYNQIGFEIHYPSVFIEELKNNIQWYHYEIKFLHTPGHSLGSICIQIEKNLFTGDTLIPNEKTVVKLPDSSTEALKQTMNKLQSLKGQNLVVYPGHGNSILLDKYDLRRMI